MAIIEQLASDEVLDSVGGDGIVRSTPMCGRSLATLAYVYRSTMTFSLHSFQKAATEESRFAATRRMSMFNWKCVIGIATISLCVASSSAQADTPSSFQKSCTNIVVSGATLQAKCRKVDGTWDSTSIEIIGIENINGVLKVTGASPSTYQKTCRDIGIAHYANLARSIIRQRNERKAWQAGTIFQVILPSEDL
jgi:hypothetical protein